MREVKVVLLPGDGIGPEVVGEARRLVDHVSGLDDMQVDWESHAVGGCAIDSYGKGVEHLFHGFKNRTSNLMVVGVFACLPLAVVIGVPMYSNAAGIIPVVQALLGKGAALARQKYS